MHEANVVVQKNLFCAVDKSAHEQIIIRYSAITINDIDLQ